VQSCLSHHQVKEKVKFPLCLIK